MVYSDTTNLNGLIQECERVLFGEYGSISDNTTRLKEFTSLLNQSLDDTALDIMRVDRNWKWDDRNHPDRPIATANIVSGQADYATDVSFLKIEKVEIKSSDGVWRMLRPIKETERPFSFEERYDEDNLPLYYDLQGYSIILFPTPNYSQDDSLKVHYQRTFSRFETSDTTKAPGCPSVFHPLIALRACYKYAFVNRMEIDRDIDAEIRRYVAELKKMLPRSNPWGRNKLLPKFKRSR